MILGCDPGLDGGLAIINGSEIELLETVPTEPKGGFIKRQVDAQKLSNILRVYPISVCYLERVASRPGQGVGSVFSFGDTYGAIRGVLGALNIPTYTIAPQTWKKYWHLTSNKDESLDVARMIWPEAPLKRKKDHGGAEALLIADYWRQVHQGVKR